MAVERDQLLAGIVADVDRTLSNSGIGDAASVAIVIGTANGRGHWVVEAYADLGRDVALIILIGEMIKDRSGCRLGKKSAYSLHPGQAGQPIGGIIRIFQFCRLLKS